MIVSLPPPALTSSTPAGTRMTSEQGVPYVVSPTVVGPSAQLGVVSAPGGKGVAAGQGLPFVGPPAGVGPSGEAGGGAGPATGGRRKRTASRSAGRNLILS